EPRTLRPLTADRSLIACRRGQRNCIIVPGDIADEVLRAAGGAHRVRARQTRHPGEQCRRAHPQESIENISAQQLERTFRTNIFAMFFLTKAAMKHLKKGAVITNTTSVTAYKGSAELLDYSSTKGAIVAFTRSLSQNLAEKETRVNGVAPGPIWTPLIPSKFDKKKVASFGADVTLKRPGQPEEVAPSYVFLASDDSSYMTGQILHPNGGSVING
ncbi:MAG TPA: SDR family oxidoreductase, partial [Chthoniobacterales bacterium]|nr:SDR family oxidoreductase [Chthoniobacterales bacterium]